MRNKIRFTKRIEGFYRFYGRHIRIFEIAILLLSTLLYFYGIEAKFDQIVIFGLGWATVVVFVVFKLTVRRLARKEKFPSEFLRLEPLLSSLYWLGFVFLIASVIAIPICAYLSIQTIFSQIFEVLIIIFTFFLSFTLASLLFGVTPPHISSFRKARLCFRLALDVLERIIELMDEERRGIVAMKVKWFKKGLFFCNSYLSKQYRFEIADTEEFSDRIFKVALLGNQDELNAMSNYVAEILDSLAMEPQYENTRDLLVALQHIRGRQGESTEVLGGMVEEVSLWEKMRKLKPKYAFSVTAIVLLLTIAIRVLDLYDKLIKFILG